MFLRFPTFSLFLYAFFNDLNAFFSTFSFCSNIFCAFIQTPEFVVLLSECCSFCLPFYRSVFSLILLSFRFSCCYCSCSFFNNRISLAIKCSRSWILFSNSFASFFEHTLGLIEVVLMF